MRARHPLPRLWLFTDERMGESLWAALDRLPPGSGVIFRHYATPAPERRRLFGRVRNIARRRRLILIVAGMPLDRNAAGMHGGQARRRRGLHTASAHNRREAMAAKRAGADLLFVSPIFPTRSHPGAKALGVVKLGLLVRGLDIPVVALGGMDARRFRSLSPLGLHGWAAIDAWTDQKRNAVPT